MITIHSVYIDLSIILPKFLITFRVLRNLVSREIVDLTYIKVYFMQRYLYQHHYINSHTFYVVNHTMYIRAFYTCKILAMCIYTFEVDASGPNPIELKPDLCSYLETIKRVKSHLFFHIQLHNFETIRIYVTGWDLFYPNTKVNVGTRY